MLPIGSGASSIASWEIRSEKPNVAGGGADPVATREKKYVPASVGLPWMVPAGESARPGGSVDPAAIDHDTGPSAASIAIGAAAYGTPTEPSGSVDRNRATFRAVNVNVRTPMLPFASCA